MNRTTDSDSDFFGDDLSADFSGESISVEGVLREDIAEEGSAEAEGSSEDDGPAEEEVFN